MHLTRLGFRRAHLQRSESFRSAPEAARFECSCGLEANQWSCRKAHSASFLVTLVAELEALVQVMVVKAYVLVQAQLGKSRTVAKAISNVKGVKMVHAVTGVYDVIAYLVLSDMESLSELVIKKIQSVKGVERTHTAIVV